MFMEIYLKLQCIEIILRDNWMRIDSSNTVLQLVPGISKRSVKIKSSDLSSHDFSLGSIILWYIKQNIRALL